MSITRATPVRSLPGEAILPQSECRARCVLWTLYHKAGRKGSAARGKRKKICLFRHMGLYYSVWEDAYPLRLAMGKPPPPRGEASFSILPWGGRFVSRESRMACLKLWAGKRILALSGFPMANHLPQKRRRVSAPCRGFTGLFHVKHGAACPKLWTGTSACPLQIACRKPPPPRGRRVSAPYRGFAGLFHVKRKRQRSFRLAASPVGNE